MCVSGRTLTILDVGHGNSAVVADGGCVIVIDAGPKAGLLEYLREQGIERIDAVLLSHADLDHIGGLISLLASGMFQISCVRVNTDSLQGSDIWDDLLYELNRTSNARTLDFRPSLTTADTGAFDCGAIQIEVLGPSGYLAGRRPGNTDRRGRRICTNSVSAVVRLVVSGQPSALLTGDLDEVGLDDLTESGTQASTPVLVFPHHGGRASGTDLASFSRRLCDLVSPRTVVFSTGRGRRYGTPRPEVVAAICDQQSDVRIVCTQLSEHCARSLPRCEPAHLNPVFAKGRECRRCCAGTIIVDLDNPDVVLPSVDEHQAFIAAAAPTALCRPGGGSSDDGPSQS